MNDSDSPGYPVERAVQTLFSHHRSLSKVYDGLRAHAAAARANPLGADRELFELMLDYIESFGDRCHQRAEERSLHAAMATHGAPPELLARAREEHQVANRLLAQLKRCLAGWLPGRPELAVEFLSCITEYTDWKFGHMHFEENLALPWAVDALSAEDWNRIAQALQGCNDPLFGTRPDPRYERLRMTLAPTVEVRPPVPYEAPREHRHAGPARL